MSAANLQAVAKAMRSRFPNRDLIVAADDDAGQPKNTGIDCAKIAAQAIDGLLAFPARPEAERRCNIDFADLTDAAIVAGINGASPWDANDAAQIARAREEVSHG